MSNRLSRENRILLSLLKSSLDTDSFNKHENIKCTPDEWSYIISTADKHSVLPLIYYKIEGQDGVSDELKRRTEVISRRTVNQNYNLLFITRYISDILSNNQIKNIVLKGPAASIYYPEPELRKSGDVDILLLDDNDIKKASRILQDKGFTLKEYQNTNHHIVFKTSENIDVELHSMMCEPFDEERINRYLIKIVKEYNDIYYKNIIEDVCLPTFNKAYTALYLIIHMLQHYLRAGFGLKLLCDWTTFWNSEVSNKEKACLKKMIDDTGLNGFVSLVTETCIYYLGLQKEKVSFLLVENDNDKNNVINLFMNDILAAEEFGHSANDRMVVMRGTSIADYLREFHHQMKLNHKRYSRYYILWPILWIITFFVFMINNYKIRKTTSLAIFRRAKERSIIAKKMNLFQN